MVYVDNHIINLNSKDAIKNNGAYLSNTAFSFQGILSDDDNILRSYISVINAQIPCSFYTIDSTNNLFSFMIPTLYTVTIPTGNYNSSNFITALQQALIPIMLVNIPITISRTTGKLSFTFPQDATVLSTSTMAEVLGITSNISCLAGVATELTYPLNLLGIKRISIQSDALNINSYNSNGFKTANILTTISVDQPAFNMIAYVNQSELNKHILRSKTINAIDIEMYDEKGNFINFNGIDWSITLCLSVEREHSPYKHDNLYNLFRGQLKSDEGLNEDKTLSRNEMELSLLEGKETPL